jgi:hypothetical protein
MTEAEAKARIGMNDKLNAEITDQTRCYAQALVTPIAIEIGTGQATPFKTKHCFSN